MNNELLSTMTQRIVRDFHPVQIILFGSYVRGDAHPQSDVDLLVVFSELVDKRKTAFDIRRTLADLPVAKDILVTTPEELARHRDLVGTALRAAQREGEILYEHDRSIRRAGQDAPPTGAESLPFMVNNTNKYT